MNLIGEVQTHRQLDEQVNAKTVAALRDDGLTCRHTEEGGALEFNEDISAL